MSEFCDPAFEDCPDATPTNESPDTAALEAFEMLHEADHMMDIANMDGQMIAALGYMSAALGQAAWPTLVFFMYRFTTADWNDKYFKDLTMWNWYGWWGLMGTNALIFGVGFLTALFTLFGIGGDFTLMWWQYGVGWGHGILQNAIVGLFAANIYLYNSYTSDIEKATNDGLAGVITAGESATRITAAAAKIPTTNATAKTAITSGEGFFVRNILIAELAIYCGMTSYFNSHYTAWMWPFVAANMPEMTWEGWLEEKADKLVEAADAGEEETEEDIDF